MTVVWGGRVTRQQPFPIRTEAECPDGAYVGQRTPKLPRFVVPEPNFAVDAARGNGSISGGDCHPEDSLLVPSQRGNFLAIIDRPQLDCRVIAAGHRTHSVAREAR